MVFPDAFAYTTPGTGEVSLIENHRSRREARQAARENRKDARELLRARSEGIVEELASISRATDGKLSLEQQAELEKRFAQASQAREDLEGLREHVESHAFDVRRYVLIPGIIALAIGLVVVGSLPSCSAVVELDASIAGVVADVTGNVSVLRTARLHSLTVSEVNAVDLSPSIASKNPDFDVAEVEIWCEPGGEILVSSASLTEAERLSFESLSSGAKQIGILLEGGHLVLELGVRGPAEIRISGSDPLRVEDDGVHRDVTLFGTADPSVDLVCERRDPEHGIDAPDPLRVITTEIGTSRLSFVRSSEPVGSTDRRGWVGGTLRVPALDDHLRNVQYPEQLEVTVVKGLMTELTASGDGLRLRWYGKVEDAKAVLRTSARPLMPTNIEAFGRNWKKRTFVIAGFYAVLFIIIVVLRDKPRRFSSFLRQIGG